MTKDKSKQIENLDDIRIRYVPRSISESLTNIAKNLGISRSSLLKPKLKEVANSYPEEMKKPPIVD